MLVSLRVMEAEIAKCDVVCANCHRIRTQQRTKADLPLRHSPSPSVTLKRKRMYWREQASMLRRLRSVPCADCGGTFRDCAMDFDHRDPSSKRYTVSRMIGRAGTAKIIGGGSQVRYRVCQLPS